MNLYLSDTHFGHANAIRFDHRPFGSVEEMDHAMIQLWNARVSKDDEVWFLGDFCHKSAHPAEWYLHQLKGRKHLIVGNHDQPILNSQTALGYFESVDQMARVVDVYERENVDVHLCHYPILQWNRKHFGSWHVYGHIHGDTGETFEIMSRFEHALNAGAVINNYTPVSLRELVANNQAFREKVRSGASCGNGYETFL